MTAELHTEMLPRLLVTALVGSLVGYEREREGKPAGVQTHGMVSLGTALFTVVSLDGFGGNP
jgi:putative Mg2+ transporter-C (MgtC) family protein